MRHTLSLVVLLMGCGSPDSVAGAEALACISGGDDAGTGMTCFESRPRGSHQTCGGGARMVSARPAEGRVGRCTAGDEGTQLVTWHAYVPETTELASERCSYLGGVFTPD